MKVLVSFIIILVSIIIIYSNIKSIPLKKNVEIIQLKNYDSVKIINEIQKNQPIILMNTLTKFNSFETLCFDTLVKLNDNINLLPKNNLLKKSSKSIYRIGEYIKSINNNDLVLFNDVDFFDNYTFENINEDINRILGNNHIYLKFINIFPNNSNTPILKNIYDSTYLFIYDGEIMVNLINPYSNKNLDNHKLIKNNNCHMVDIADTDKNTLKVIQIIGRTGKIIYIPQGWYYYYTSIKSNIVVTGAGTNIFKYYLN